MRRAWTIAAVVGGHAVLIAALFWRVWGGDRMSGWDCAVEYWPDLVFQVKSIGAGRWPAWNPHVLGGYPYWADPQTGLYHPLTWVLWLLAAIGGTGPWLIQAKVLLTILAGACGMHGWMFARTRSHAAAAVAAITLVACAPVLTFKNSALLWPVMWAPWALWALERFVLVPSVRRGAALAGALWLVAAAGGPPSAFYVMLVIVAFAVFLAVPARRRLVRAWPALLVAAVLTVLLLLATYVPASQIADTSQRAERGLGYVLQQPLAWRGLDELLAPRLDTNWMHDLYLGALPLLGGVWLIATQRGRARAEAGLWVGVVVLGLLLALGRDGHVLPWLAEHVPGFGLWRIAYRYKLVSAIAAAVLAGGTLAALEREAPRWARLAFAGGAVVWLVGALAVGGSLVAVGLAAAVLGLAGASGLLPRLSLAVPAFVFLELWSASAPTLAILQKVPPVERQLAAAEVLEGTRGPWRYHVGNGSSPYGGTVPYHVAVLSARRELSGYPNPIESRRHVELMKRAKKTPALLRHFNVRYFAGHRTITGRAIAPGIVAVDDVAPFARWYGAVEARAGAAALDALAGMAPSQRRAAFVEPRDVARVPVVLDGAAPVDGTLVRHDADEVVVEIDAPAPGLLVVAEAWSPGWEAEVSGVAAPVLRADYDLRGVPVPAGRSRVVLRFAPPLRTALLLAFVLGLVLLAASLAAPLERLDEVRA